MTIGTTPYRDPPPRNVDEIAVDEPRSTMKPAVLIALGLLAIQIAICGARLGLAVTAIDALVAAIGLGWMAYVRSSRRAASRQLKLEREVEKLLRG